MLVCAQYIPLLSADKMYNGQMIKLQLAKETAKA